MSSLAGLLGMQLIAPYASSKAFAWNLAEALYHELKPNNIDVMACIAGATATEAYLKTNPQYVSLKPQIQKPTVVADSALKELGKRAIYISGRFEQKWLNSTIVALSLAFVVYIASSFGVSITWLILIALIVTLGMCWFLKFKYAMGAILALIHDVTITIGAFALTNREISLAIIAAFLTIVGYSLNDTIVVFDRIRENLKRFQRRSFEDVMNTSINETLSRTILTSMTTLIVVVALFVFGGGVIHDFAFAIFIGVIVGTYSSMFVASPILLVWESKFSKRLKATDGTG